jgi:hypothetical protein
VKGNFESFVFENNRSSGWYGCRAFTDPCTVQEVQRRPHSVLQEGQKQQHLNDRGREGRREVHPED